MRRYLLPLLFTLFAAGCSTTAPRSSYVNPQDPYESMNRKVYAFNDALDKAVVKPVAEGYVKVVPDPGRRLINNFFSNLNDVNVTVNDLLQLKFKQALSDGSRVLFNTTFGLFGFLDIAHRLPKHNEDFGQTLGYWGVPSGPYLVLPILGPSSIRDGIGRYGDGTVNVIDNARPIYRRNTGWVADGINTRANLLEYETTLNDLAFDRYNFLRDAYLMRRQSLVYDGNPPRKHYDEDDEEED